MLEISKNLWFEIYDNFDVSQLLNLDETLGIKEQVKTSSHC